MKHTIACLLFPAILWGCSSPQTPVENPIVLHHQTLSLVSQVNTVVQIYGDSECTQLLQSVVLKAGEEQKVKIQTCRKGELYIQYQNRDGQPRLIKAATATQTDWSANLPADLMEYAYYKV